MVALVKKYGTERIIVNSAADWGVSDPLKVPKTAAAMREAGISEADIELVLLAATRCASSPRAGGWICEEPRRAKVDQRAAVGGQLGPARPAAPRRLLNGLPDAPDAGARRRRADPEAAAPHARPVGAGRPRGRCGRCATITPAVTCSVQSTFTTGLLPSGHGCVANGWYFRDLSEVWLWRQSNHLVQRREDLGRGQEARPGLHLRQAVLVVQHVRQRRTSR